MSQFDVLHIRPVNPWRSGWGSSGTAHCPGPTLSTEGQSVPQSKVWTRSGIKPTTYQSHCDTHRFRSFSVHFNKMLYIGLFCEMNNFHSGGNTCNGNNKNTLINFRPKHFTTDTKKVLNQRHLQWMNEQSSSGRYWRSFLERKSVIGSWVTPEYKPGLIFRAKPVQPSFKKKLSRAGTLFFAPCGKTAETIQFFGLIPSTFTSVAILKEKEKKKKRRLPVSGLYGSTSVNYTLFCRPFFPFCVAKQEVFNRFPPRTEHYRMSSFIPAGKPH